ncbi:MAG TPA: hypothetical protein VKA34_12585 [Balneolales bacterium]|nr:hypothetical protein [Balneolales bacterium]
MLSRIKNLDDVEKFTKALIEEGVIFHPDEDFIDYISLDTYLPTYTKDEAKKRNQLMDECFKVCNEEGINTYQYMLKIKLKKTSLDKLFPLSD